MFAIVRNSCSRIDTAITETVTHCYLRRSGLRIFAKKYVDNKTSRYIIDNAFSKFRTGGSFLDCRCRSPPTHQTSSPKKKLLNHPRSHARQEIQREESDAPRGRTLWKHGSGR